MATTVQMVKRFCEGVGRSSEIRNGIAGLVQNTE